MTLNPNTRYLKYLPEIFLFSGILVVIIMDLINTSCVNYGMIICGLLLSILVVWKNKYLALCVGLILGLGSFYMLFALLSEFHEFPAEDKNGTQLLFIGVMMFLTLLAVSVILPVKYFEKK
jgi:hypothetical protein